MICDHYLETTQAPFVGGSVICLNTGCGTIGGLATALLFPEMTFLQRKGGTKGIKQEVKGGKQHSTVVLWEFGTNSVQLRERKNGPLVPKRHQMKHLDFLILLLESRRSAVQNHSPLPLFLLSSIIYAAFDDADFWTIFGTSSGFG